MMIEKQKFLIIYIISGYAISMCSSQSTPKSQLVELCTKWNISAKQLIFGQGNGTAGNDDGSLNLMNSGLGINTDTGEIAVLDDNNHRILVFNQSNNSTLFAILSDSSNLTNNSMIHYSPSAIVYDRNNSIYILDSWARQIIKMNNPLEYGENATLITNLTSPNVALSLNYTGVGLCIDNTDGSIFVADYDHHQIIRYGEGVSIYSRPTYIGDGTAGDASDQLNHPTSIVMNNDRTLFVNDVGNNRIQMFEFNSTNGTTLPTNISGCIGLSLYLPDILVINTKTAVYFFNLTSNETTCVIGCNGSGLNDSHNAVIDASGNLIVTDSNQVLSYSIHRECSEVTVQPTTKTTASTSFNPVNHCGPGKFGINCLSSENICDMNQPCFNSGTCTENKTNNNGYICQCPWGFNGTNCEEDQRPCKPFTCFLRGNCVNISTTNFTCQCFHGYEGKQCEKTVDFCANATCQNRGVCFQQFLNYTCKCLLGFNGRHCEITETGAAVRAYVRKSFGYIAIIMLVSLVGFFIIMDVLKYGFGIDPVQSDRDALQKKQTKTVKKKNQVERPKVAVRFQYVN